ncbi:putative cytochrome P450 301a1, mitochondrial [Rhipicephalus microplus]|uniref:putative cytochrome P450 301a1, mitochondrial n=1 Tax=Rhipicephalus microplus TaxID=6941 RepID=UPI003F6A867B
MNRVLQTFPYRVAVCKSRRATMSPSTARKHCASSNNKKPFRQIPRIPALPLIGSSWIYCRFLRNGDPDERHKVSMEMYRKYGPIFVERPQGRHSVVHIVKGTDIRILHKEEGKEPFRLGAAPLKHYRESRPQYYANVGLLNLQGKEWLSARSRMQPHMLKVRAATSYLPIMHRISDEALSLLDELMDANGCVKDCFYFFRRWALESIASTTADVELCCLKNPLNPESDGAAILDDIKTAFVCIQKLGYRFPYLHYLLTPTWQIFKKTMEDFTTRTYRHIDAAAHRIEEEKLVSKATILRNLLLEKKLTFGEIFTYTSDFILAGVDTTAFAMTCLLFQLAKNQEAQKKVRQEVQAAVEENSRTIMPEPENMPFLQACLKESLRLMPPSPGIYRVLDHDAVMSGYVVPAGVPIFIDYYVAGRITENFDNPEVFLPERWLKVQREDLHFDRYASLPFSFGPRMCPGRTIAELQVCLLASKILLKYEVHCDKEDIDFHRRLGNVPNESVDFSFKRISLPAFLKVAT